MKNILASIISIAFCIFSIESKSQKGLIKKVLNQDDKEHGMIARYANPSPAYAWSEIELFKNNTFHYNAGTDFTGSKFSDGKWVRKNDTVILNSFLDSENLPILIKYTTDESKLTRRTNLSMVKNKADSILFLTAVLINNNKTICIPALDTCLGDKFARIDSIKIDLENGLKSKWITITETNYKQIQITVNLWFEPANYRPIYSEKWLLKGKYLKRIKQP